MVSDVEHAGRDFEGCTRIVNATRSAFDRRSKVTAGKRQRLANHDRFDA